MPLKRAETNLSLSEKMTGNYFSLVFLFVFSLLARGNGQDEGMVLGKLKEMEAHRRSRRLAAYYDPFQLSDSTVPHALTPEMFHGILRELRSVNSQLAYDSDYFMDYASSQHNKCPFQGDPSQISFMVLTGKVEYGKIDNFGMALALGKKVPYNDLDIRDNLENIARKWKPYSQFSAPRKFGCSIIPNCSEDIILACAFYPIDSTWPFPTASTPVYTTPPQELKACTPYNLTNGFQNLYYAKYLEDRAVSATECSGTNYEGYSKTPFEGRFILSGSRNSSNHYEHDLNDILNEMRKQISSHEFDYGCCHMKCQQLVLLTCVFEKRPTPPPSN